MRISPAPRLLSAGLGVLALAGVVAAAPCPSTSTPAEIPLSGVRPFALAFDGARLWATDFQGDRLLALDPVSAAILLDTTVAGGPPILDGRDLVLEGENVWVASQGDGGVFRVRRADAVVTYQTDVGSEASGLAFDGTHLWVSNRLTNEVTRFLASDGSGVRTLDLTDSAGGVQQLAWDGICLWALNGPSDRLYELGVAGDGSPLLVETIDLGVVTDARSLIWSSPYLWVGDRAARRLLRYRASGGRPGGPCLGRVLALDGWIDLPAINPLDVTALAAAGPFLFAADGTNDLLEQIPRDGGNATFSVLGPDATPVGLAATRGWLWSANYGGSSPSSGRSIARVPLLGWASFEDGAVDTCWLGAS